MLDEPCGSMSHAVMSCNPADLGGFRDAVALTGVKNDENAQWLGKSSALG
jgi:hypothetical protein